MTLSRRLRRWVSGGLMMAVLFTQLAVAAYLCPAPVAAEAALAMASEMPDCHGMAGRADPAQPRLCKAHCGNEAQSNARAAAPDLQPNPASVALLVRVIEPIAPVLPLAAFEGAPSRDRVAQALPLYLSLHVLRN